MTKYYLSFHTIFILDENIKWLEEFIIYYLYLGFEHFYLYDNEKTTGGDGTQTENKYGFKIDVNNNENNQRILNNILNKYNKYITYIKWQPQNDKNEIVYGQTEGITHFIKNYGDETEWVAFLDLDEFIYSQKI
jgi:glutamine synthetase